LKLHSPSPKNAIRPLFSSSFSFCGLVCSGGGGPYDSPNLNPYNQRKYGRIFEYGLRCSTGQTNGKFEADTVRGRGKKVSRHGGEYVVNDCDVKLAEFSATRTYRMVPRIYERMWDAIQGSIRHDLGGLYVCPWEPIDLRGFVLAPKASAMCLANVCHPVVFTLSLMMTSSNCDPGPDSPLRRPKSCAVTNLVTDGSSRERGPGCVGKQRITQCAERAVGRGWRRTWKCSSKGRHKTRK